MRQSQMIGPFFIMKTNHIGNLYACITVLFKTNVQPFIKEMLSTVELMETTTKSIIFILNYAG